VLEKLRQEVSEHNLQEARNRRQEAELKTRIANLESCLGSGDPEREETYWRLIKEARTELDMVQQRPPPSTSTSADIERVAHFLENLEGDWQRYPSRLRNRLLTLLVDRVELRHDQTNIEATIFWKAGFKQRLRIRRPSAHCTKEKRWLPEEDKLLAMLWPSSSREVITAAFPARAWAAINQRASRLKLKRHWEKKLPDTAHLWTEGDEKELRELYTRGVKVTDIAGKLGRSEQAIKARASLIGASRPKGFYPRKVEPVWEAENIKVMHESTSRSVRW